MKRKGRARFDGIPGWTRDPYLLCDMLWPDIGFYTKQREVIESVDINDETFVPAGNKLGKDYVAGFIALRFFLIHAGLEGGCRVITTSIKDDHLRVLWGEIGRFIQTSRIPLLRSQGGILVYNHHDIRYVHSGGRIDQISYMRGMVSELGEGMAGHHARYTLAILDECSGIQDVVYDQVRTWAKKILCIGNPLDCNNFWRKAIKGGDVKVGYQIDSVEVE